MNTNDHARPPVTAAVLTIRCRETLANPEYVRMPRAGERLMGIGRSQLYKLIGDGSIRSRSVGRMRLIHIPSLVAFIESAK